MPEIFLDSKSVSHTLLEFFYFWGLARGGLRRARGRLNAGLYVPAAPRPAPRYSKKLPSPPFEAAHPAAPGFGHFLEALRAPGLPCGFAVLTPARMVVVDYR